MGIGNNIKELRLRRGLTQEMLALKIGVTPSAVGNYEREFSFPKEEVLLKLFGALDCTPNELFGSGALPRDEYAHLNKYRALDEHGKRIVDACTDTELRRIGAESDDVPIAARKGTAADRIKLQKRDIKSILDLPDYKGGYR